MIEKFREDTLKHLKKWGFDEIEEQYYDPYEIVAVSDGFMVRVTLKGGF